MKEIELRITVAGRDVTAFRYDSGSEWHGKVSPSLSRSGLDRKVLEVLVSVLRTGRIRGREELEVLGSLLYRAIFDSEIEKGIDQSLEDAKAAGSPLRMRLQFADARQIPSHWPWEFLHRRTNGTSEGFFLAVRSSLTLSRFVGVDQPLQPPALEPRTVKLKVLSMISNGQGLHGPDGEEPSPIETETLFSAIDKLAEGNPIRREPLVDPTLDAFQDKLTSFRPHVLHFIGYGRIQGPNHDPQIGFFHDSGVCKWGDRDQVPLALEAVKTPPVVVLHLVPWSVTPGVWPKAAGLEGSFAGLADRLIRQGTHAAIAMHYPMPPVAAVVFSRVLYANLAEGLPIEDAVQKARQMLSIVSSADDDARSFGAPLLYSHHAQFPIIERRPDEATPSYSMPGPSMLGSPKNPQLSTVPQTLQEAIQ